MSRRAAQIALNADIVLVQIWTQYATLRAVAEVSPRERHSLARWLPRARRALDIVIVALAARKFSLAYMSRPPLEFPE